MRVSKHKWISMCCLGFVSCRHDHVFLLRYFSLQQKKRMVTGMWHRCGVLFTVYFQIICWRSAWIFRTWNSWSLEPKIDDFGVRNLQFRGCKIGYLGDLKSILGASWGSKAHLGPESLQTTMNHFRTAFGTTFWAPKRFQNQSKKFAKLICFFWLVVVRTLLGFGPQLGPRNPSQIAKTYKVMFCFKYFLNCFLINFWLILGPKIWQKSVMKTHPTLLHMRSGRYSKNLKNNMCSTLLLVWQGHVKTMFV